MFGHGLALVALAGVLLVGVLLAGGWVHRIDSALPTVEADSAHPAGDRRVLALTADPYTSVAETYRTLHALERLFRDRDDRRAVFLTVYTRVTREVAAGIERGAFENPDWVARYLVTFANFYREALHRFETGDVASLPAAWRLFFRATGAEDALVVQCAVLGINAHVNYDLALALRTVGIDEGRAAKYRDHRRINAVLWRLVGESLDRLATRYVPGLATVARLAGPLGERLWFCALAVGREAAWWSAVALSDARWRALRPGVRRTHDWVSGAVAVALLGPNAHSRLVGALRRVETARPDR